MRSLSALALAAALALPVAAPALADDAMPPMITVTGEGVVEAAPDIATLSIGVTTQGATAAEALAANNVAMDAVVARLTAAGIAGRDLQTSSLSLGLDYSRFDSSKSDAPTSYVASNMLTVRVRVLDTLGTVLDAAVADGANTLNGLTFGLADSAPALNEARKEAVADARARAELLATAAGVRLGKVVSISESPAASGPMPMFRADAAASPVPVQGGELGLTAQVTIFYEIVE